MQVSWKTRQWSWGDYSRLATRFRQSFVGTIFLRHDFCQLVSHAVTAKARQAAAYVIIFFDLSQKQDAQDTGLAQPSRD
jgi:hypothetical protein